jgi:hypothetical protein
MAVLATSSCALVLVLVVAVVLALKSQSLPDLLAITHPVAC